MAFQMRDIVSRAVVAALVIVASASCGGAGTIPAEASRSTQISSSSDLSMAATPTHQSRLYVVDVENNVVDIFNAGSTSSQPTGDITQGLSVPFGLYVDDNGTLYVANRYPSGIVTYPNGQTTPSTTLSLDPSFLVDDVAVSPDGTIFVAGFPEDPSALSPNIHAFSKSSQTHTMTAAEGIALSSSGLHQKILEFEKGATTPSRTIALPTCTIKGLPGQMPVFEGGMTFDRAGNLLLDESSSFVVGYGACDTAILVYPPRSNIADGRVPFTPCELGPIERIDKRFGDGSLLIGDEACSSLYVLPMPYKPGKKYDTVSLFPDDRFALDRQSQTLYNIDIYAGDIEMLDLRTGKIIGTIANVTPDFFPNDVAINPPDF